MKLGTFDIPANHLDKMLEATGVVYNEFQSDEVSKKDLAPILGHKTPRSGALGQKIADMHAYGLLEGGRDKYKVSKIGEDALWGTPEEKSAAIEKAVRNIPLWSIFLDKYGNSIKEQNFWVNLRKITGVESRDAQTNAATVRNAYMADVRLLKNVGEPTKTSQSQEAFGGETADRTSTMQAQQIGPKMVVISIESPEVVNRYVISDSASYDNAIEQLKSVKPMVKLEEKQSERSQNTGVDKDNGSNKNEDPKVEEIKQKPT